MENKTGPVVAIFAFAVCFAVGYMVMAVLWPMGQTSDANPSAQYSAPADVTTLEPSTIMYVQVNDMSLAAPQVEAIWVVFLQPSQPANITMLRILPSATSDRDIAISNALSIQPNMMPGPGFGQTIQSFFDVSWDGMIITDRDGADTWNTWLAQQSTSTGGSFDPILYTVDPQQAAAQACRYLSLEGWNIVDNSPLQQLVPNHFQTDVYIEQLLTDWSTLLDPQNPPVCEAYIQY
ncbi:MAG TPA: hypothetical protein VN376_07645 [Longilinea sp.]|nr:hypothetical protein [Longilinea sp.]